VEDSRETTGGGRAIQPGPVEHEMHMGETWEVPPHNGLSVSGVEAPNVTIVDAELTAIGDDGAPQWRFALECQKALVDALCPTAGGAKQPVAEMSLKIVSSPASNSISYSEAEALFLTPGVAAVVDATMGKHGGLRASVTGIAPLALHRSFLLVVRYADKTVASYRYFPVSVEAPSN
jgi:hypothetical protein